MTTDELLEQARTVGRMIRETAVYHAYAKAARDLDNDGTARELLAEYARLRKEIDECHAAGEPAPKSDVDELARYTARMNDNDTVRAYLQAEREYGRLLTAIQQELAKSDPANEAPEGR